MTEDEYKANISKFIADIESIRNAHNLDACLYKGELDWQKRLKTMSESKAAAYDFVIRKLKRAFNIVNENGNNKKTS